MSPGVQRYLVVAVTLLLLERLVAVGGYLLAFVL